MNNNTLFMDDTLKNEKYIFSIMFRQVREKRREKFAAHLKGTISTLKCRETLVENHCGRQIKDCERGRGECKEKEEAKNYS
jgi:hypothetical protein